MKSETKACQNCKTDFTIEPEDFQFYERIQVPPPTECPNCRLQRRFSFRNERSLYKRKCDLCGENIIAMHSAEKPYKVYCPSCFYSDKWDPIEYGRDYDFSRPFFEQFRELDIATPQIGLIWENSINSPWVNYELNDKNCYLNFGGHYNEDCAYNQYVLKCKDSFDNYWQMNGQFIYETLLSENCYKTFFSKFCFDCQETFFSFDCRNCSNIIGCSGLRHKKYHIFNQPVSKNEFEKFLNEYLDGSDTKLKELRSRCENFIREQPQKATFTEKTVNSTGNNIKESKNCMSCWSSERTEDSKHIMFSLDMKDSMDTTSVWGGNLFYEFIAGAEQLSNIKFSVSIVKTGQNIEYSDFLIGCQDCFGCTRLRSKKYCILNKQYDKTDYENLIVKIKKQMNEMPFKTKNGRTQKYGEFFPRELSHFGYNETVANEYFPETEENAYKMGFNWHPQEHETDYQISDYQIPDNIKDVKDDILDKILKCEASGKAYRIIPMELQFYRRFNLPIPRLAPFERHKKRMRFIADHMKLAQRKCSGCEKLVDSVYNENEFPKIYCEDCYLRNIIQ